MILSEPQGQPAELSVCLVHMKYRHINSHGSSCLKLEGLAEHLERDWILEIQNHIIQSRMKVLISNCLDLNFGSKFLSSVTSAKLLTTLSLFLMCKIEIIIPKS